MNRADPRTTRRYDRTRGNLDRHATYTVAALLAAGDPSDAFERQEQP